MSSFNGENLFGSGPHRIAMGEPVSAVSEFSFPGFHGAFGRGQGLKTQPITVRGTLRAADAAARTGS